MSEAGDLHWERTQAGLYHTLFYANGYRYKIVKDEYYPSWRCRYMWHKDSKKEWRSLRVSRYSNVYDTLKEAKAACLRHNMSPRKKYKLVQRVPDDNEQPRGTRNKLEFRPVDEKGEFSKYRYDCEYLDPRKLTMSDEEIKADDERIEREKREAQAKKDAASLEQIWKIHNMERRIQNG